MTTRIMLREQMCYLPIRRIAEAGSHDNAGNSHYQAPYISNTAFVASHKDRPTAQIFYRRHFRFDQAL